MAIILAAAWRLKHRRRRRRVRVGARVWRRDRRPAAAGVYPPLSVADRVIGSIRSRIGKFFGRRAGFIRDGVLLSLGL